MSQATPPNFTFEQVEGVTVVTAACPQIVADLRDEFYALAVRPADAPPGPWRVVLDLSGVRQINSAAIGILINFQKRVRDAGGTLKVCGIHPNVIDVFRLTKMDQILDLCPTRKDALDAYQGRGRPSTPTSAGTGERSGGSWFSRIFGGK